MKTRFGNFLADGVFDGFDNTFFRISPKEARALDPQMRLLMRVGFQAAEAAGLLVDTDDDDARTSTAYSTLRGEDVGCFVGVATSDYALNLKNDVGVHYATGDCAPITTHINARQLLTSIHKVPSRLFLPVD